MRRHERTTFIVKSEPRNADWGARSVLDVAPLDGKSPIGQIKLAWSESAQVEPQDGLIVEHWPVAESQTVLDANEMLSLGRHRDNPRSYIRLRGLPLEWLSSEMSQIASSNGIPSQATDTWVHSTEVYRLAMEIVDCLLIERVRELHPYLGKDWEFSSYLLEKACYAHDIGRMSTGSKASTVIEHGLLHGAAGAAHFRKIASNSKNWNAAEMEDLEVVARVCERHVLGPGMTAAFVEDKWDILEASGIPKADLLAEHLYEKIIGYADWRIHPLDCGSVSFPKRVREEDAVRRTTAFDIPLEQLTETLALCGHIRYMTDYRVP